MGLDTEETPRIRGANPWGKRVPLSVLGSPESRRARTKAGEMVPFYVVLMATTRHYGGPEEGGWWYNNTSRKEVWKVWTFREALAKVRQMMDEYQPNRHDRYSVLGGEDWEVHLCYEWEDVPEEDLGRPRYE